MSECSPEYWIWLQKALGAGARTDELLSHFGNPEQLYNAGSREWRLSGIVTQKRIEALLKTSPSETYAVFSECRKKGYKIITPDSPEYPDRFRTLKDMPLVLYAAGDVSVLKNELSIGMVGTRNASTYGIETAQKLAYVLASSGVTIVSGGALGIDSEAHAGAMLANGKTVAFLGCGLSCKYLSENAPLRRAIARHGAVVSEYLPEQAASRSTFPIRNRLISGLTLGTVVVEAGKKSGSLITASFALEQGRDVFAVPGDIIRSSFDGTNHLIQNGAKPVFGAEDILSEYEYRCGSLIDREKAKMPISSVRYVDYRNYKSSKAKPQAAAAEPSGSAALPSKASGLKPAPAVKTEQKVKAKQKADTQAAAPGRAVRKELSADISPEARIIYAALGENEIQIDDIVRQTGIKMKDVLSALTELELEGAVEQLNGKKYKII